MAKQNTPQHEIPNPPDQVLKSIDGNDRAAIRRQTWRIAVPVIIANSSIPLVGIVDTALYRCGGDG
jgi:Na+-driven multidrug efflux pump